MNIVNRLSGTPLVRALSSSSNKRGLTLFALLAASTLAGCQTDGTLTSVTDTEVLCVDPIIRYSRHDTLPTIASVREHNAYHRNLGCPQ